MVVEPESPDTRISASSDSAPEESGAESRIHIAGSSDAEPNIPIVDLSALSALRLPAEPGLLALRLPYGHPVEGRYDGAWWPQSRDIHAELPGLIAVLTEHLAPVDRVGLDADAWDGLGTPLYVDGRHILVDWFPVGEETLLIPLGDLGTCSLLTIAPDAGVDEADAAMTTATGIEGPNTDDENVLLVVTAEVHPA